MQDSKFFVEGPDSDLIDASHSAGVAVRRQESGCVNAQYCGSFSPAVEKRIRRIGNIKAVHHQQCESGHNDSPALDNETTESIRKIKEDVGALLEDFATLRDDFATMREDVMSAMSSTDF